MRILTLSFLTILLAGCGTQAVATLPPTVTPLPTATPTVGVSFVVAVTAITTRVRPTATPQPTATPTIAAGEPTLRLSSFSGPPQSRTIIVQGFNLPPRKQVTLWWATKGEQTGLSTTTFTDTKGHFSSRFSIPGSSPGDYHINAVIDDAEWASATYTVRSYATISARAWPSHGGETVQVAGAHFVPRLKILLAVYPTVKGMKPQALGTTETNQRGSFTFVTTTKRLAIGQYVLRAYSTSSISAQMAESIFQVVN